MLINVNLEIENGYGVYTMSWGINIRWLKDGVMHGQGKYYFANGDHTWGRFIILRNGWDEHM